MELQISIPSRPGQICKIINPLDDKELNNVYIIAEDPQHFDDDDTIYVVALKELQRNIKHPESAAQIPVTKNKLMVVADNLEDYIESWNNS
ncbi:hypothetical protein [Mucilaginibacter sp. OK098]|uniref:hypothetical protein n=1 Tax=Mucilaginibacter sp. OK098 TaxID=1855297 RepID=UPI00091AEA4C|nr:hypothetical protein [Mucilaginibacter sp. OK098]SHL95809.1 hypothetical protein SAMN05216524_101317 [Mucilaginibacter sp. OK098]